MKPIFLPALAVLVSAVFAPEPSQAQDGSLARCGALSAPAAEVVLHCRRAISNGGLRQQQEFAAGLNLGDALLSLGRPGEALGAFEAASALGLERVELYIGRASAHEALGQRLEAARDLDKALALAPSSTDVRLARGAFFLRIGQSAAALEEFDAAIARDGQDADARFNRGLTLIALGRNDAAVADFTAVLRDYPNDAGAYHQRGRAREGRDNAGALADYDRAAELSPEWAAPRFQGGVLLDQLGRREEANNRFRRAFELGFKDPWLLKRIRELGG